MPGIVTAVQDWASTISSRYHLICKQSACRPLAPSVTCGDSSLPEGAMGCCVSTLDLWELEVPAVESLSHGYAVPAPFRKGAFGVYRPKPPWPLWGWFGEAKPGGFPRLAGFHIGSYFGKVPAVESLSHGCAVPAPFGKGAFLCPVSLLRCRIGHRQSPAGTTPSANNQLVARGLPQSPAVTAPSRREL